MGTLIVPPQLDGEEIARILRELKKQMSIVEMQRLSGVDRQVLYRLMGGSSVNRTPYELVVKLMMFISQYYEVPQAEDVATEESVVPLVNIPV